MLINNNVRILQILCAPLFFGGGCPSRGPGPQATLTQWCRQFHCGLRRRWGDRFDLVSVALRWFGSPVSCVWVINPSKYILKVVPPLSCVCWFVGLYTPVYDYILSIEFAEWTLLQLKYGIARMMMWRGIFYHSSAGSVTHNIKFVDMAAYYFLSDMIQRKNDSNGWIVLECSAFFLNGRLNQLNGHVFGY